MHTQKLQKKSLSLKNFKKKNTTQSEVLFFCVSGDNFYNKIFIAQFFLSCLLNKVNSNKGYYNYKLDWEIEYFLFYFFNSS